MSIVKSFTELKDPNVLKVGGKGYSLVVLTNNGFNVPKGFVITLEAFFKYLKQNNLIGNIEKLSSEINEDNFQKKSKEIKNLILNSKISKEITSGIESNLKRLNAKYVSIRSSAVSEDSLTASFAGLRGVVAQFLGSHLVISAERESHDGRIKINQTDITIEHFKDFLVELGVKHIQPLRYVRDGKEIEQLIGWNWAEGTEQPKCIFTANYRDTQGRAIHYPKRVESYLKNFLLPVTRSFLQLRQQEVSNIQDEINQVVKKLLNS